MTILKNIDLESVKNADDSAIKVWIDPDGVRKNLLFAVITINCSIELAKRNGKPYDRLQVVLTALLETAQRFDEAQSEIDDLLNL